MERPGNSKETEGKLGCEKHFRWPKVKKTITRAVYFPVTRVTERILQIAGKICRLRAHGGRMPSRVK